MWYKNGYAKGIGACPLLVHWRDFMDKYKILVKGVVTKEDRYLIVERWYDDRISEPYQWEFIDGVAHFGESPDKAVVRTVFEKTGLNTCIGKILYTWSFMLGDVCNIGIAYQCIAAQDDVILSEDLIDSKWISEQELSKYITNEKVLNDLEKNKLNEL